jgi:hypothetical protein
MINPFFELPDKAVTYGALAELFPERRFSPYTLYCERHDFVTEQENAIVGNEAKKCDFAGLSRPLSMRMNIISGIHFDFLFAIRLPLIFSILTLAAFGRPVAVYFYPHGRKFPCASPKIFMRIEISRDAHGKFFLSA